MTKVWLRAMSAMAAGAAMLAHSGPALAIPAMNQGPFIVYFEWDRTNLTPEAVNVLNSMMREWRGQQACFTLAGHTDRSRSAAYNVALSQRMAQSVANYLAARGVSSAAVRTTAFGEARNRVPTRDGVREPQNRRVEILVGPC